MTVLDSTGAGSAGGGAGGGELALVDVPIDYPSQWPPDSGQFGPNPRQDLAHALAPHADELLYGGARGGGKTDFALAEGLRRCLLIPGFQAVFFRRTYRELSGQGGAIPRLMTRVPRNVGRWNAQSKTWRFFNGSSLALSFLDKPADVQAWMGLELQLMIFDQVEQIEEDTYVFVRTSLRVTGRVAAAMRAEGLRPAAIATANPGGIGHSWVKKRFIDPIPTGERLFRAAPTESEPRPLVRAFVPARLEDNPALDEGDPNYRALLEGLGADDRKAQLEGDWNVYKGARFADFRTDVHVVDPEDFPLPPLGSAPRACSVDYGADHPFVALWGVALPDGGVYVYREVWDTGRSPAEQAQLILDAEEPMERTRFPVSTVLDSACWAAPPEKPTAPSRSATSSTRAAARALNASGPPEGSIADMYVKAGVDVARADKRRLEGTAAISALLKVRPDGQPRIYISSQCTLLIETLPQMQRDPKRPEDYRKVEGDDAVDALRYLVMEIAAGAGGRTPPEPPNPRRGAAPMAGLQGGRIPAVPTAPAGTLRRRGF